MGLIHEYNRRAKRLCDEGICKTMTEARRLVLKDRDKFFLALKKLKDFCGLIGCSGLSDKCPGDRKCKIIQKALKERPDLFDIDNNE